MVPPLGPPFNLAHWTDGVDNVVRKGDGALVAQGVPHLDELVSPSRCQPTPDLRVPLTGKDVL